MRLVVGLGNVGKRYKLTRHNFGFLALQSFAKEDDIVFKKEKNFLICKHQNFALVKPTTFMNDSGLAVVSAINYYKFEDLLVISDDVNLPFGKIKVKKSGSSGGHRGLGSIEKHLGSRDFNRLRFGVGGGDLKHLSNYVLSGFTAEQKRKLPAVFSFTSLLIRQFVSNGIESMIEFFSREQTAYSKLVSLESLKTKGE